MIGPSSVAFHLSVRTTWTPTEGTSEMSSATSECHPAWGLLPASSLFSTFHFPLLYRRPGASLHPFRKMNLSPVAVCDATEAPAAFMVVGTRRVLNIIFALPLVGKFILGCVPPRNYFSTTGTYPIRITPGISFVRRAGFVVAPPKVAGVIPRNAIIDVPHGHYTCADIPFHFCPALQKVRVEILFTSPVATPLLFLQVSP